MFCNYLSQNRMNDEYYQRYRAWCLSLYIQPAPQWTYEYVLANHFNSRGGVKA